MIRPPTGRSRPHGAEGQPLDAGIELCGAPGGKELNGDNSGYRPIALSAADHDAVVSAGADAVIGIALDKIDDRRISKALERPV